MDDKCVLGTGAIQTIPVEGEIRFGGEDGLAVVAALNDVLHFTFGERAR
jgi:hypothetical protein